MDALLLSDSVKLHVAVKLRTSKSQASLRSGALHGLSMCEQLLEQKNI